MTDKDCLKKVIALRRQIHQCPELGGREFKTTALAGKTLKAAGIRYKRFHPTGLMAELGNKPGPCVAIRADMDALPLAEKTQSVFQSRCPGIMHACGHDAHTAMVLTTALRLAKEARYLPGQVKFFFQPDEETSQGARQLVKQGVMDCPKVQAVFGLHVFPWLPAGTIGIKPGPLMASVDRFFIEIIGEGGHGAYPHNGRDAIAISAHVIQSLQYLVARQVDPVAPVVVTVGTVQGGNRFNILADKVVLTGTVRTLSDYWHGKMSRIIPDTVKGMVKALGGTCRIRYDTLSHAVINNAPMAALARKAAVKVVGQKKVIDLEHPSMGGEDFSEYLKKAPGCFVYLGTGADAKTKHPWHHPSFFLHEPSMLVGVKFLSELTKQCLSRLNANEI